MGLIMEIWGNLLFNVRNFFNYNALPSSISSNKRKRPFAIMGNKKKKFKVDANTNDMLVALLPEFRELIIQKFDIVDYHRLSAVCKSWRSIATTTKQSQCFSLQQLPWLVLSSNKNDLLDAHHGFFNLFHEKIFNLELPKIYGAQFCGSSLGWLMMADGIGDNFLLHPFSRLQIQLPSPTTIPSLFHRVEHRQPGPICIHKVVLSSPPIVTSVTSTASDIEVVDSAVGNCFVVALYGRSGLCFCRPWDQAWTELNQAWTRLNQIFPVFPVHFEDIIWYNRQLYAVDFDYDLIVFDLGLYPSGTRLNLPCPTSYDRKYRKGGQFIYLVESCGELLMVVRIWNCERDRLPNHFPSITTTFDIFKLDPIGHCWVKVESLGDRLLFVGASSGISVSTRYFSSFEGNCIYFIHDSFSILKRMIDCPKACLYVGVFTLADGSVKSFSPAGSHSAVCLPIWFMPSPL